MEPIDKFTDEVRENIRRLGEDAALTNQSLEWMKAVHATGNYTYNFTWLGRPNIQFPQDMVAMQELIWSIKPDLIIETGIAHGGSLVFSASMLALLDLDDAIAAGNTIDPKASSRKVLGIDIDIRAHNRAAIEAHPMASRIQMIEGSSIAPETIEQVKEVEKDYRRILVCLDSNHTHDHVCAELEAYSPLVTVGSYCVVFDTLIEDIPAGSFPDKPWDIGNNPRTAVEAFIKTNDRFEVDYNMDAKLQISVAPGGYLKCVSE